MAGLKYKASDGTYKPLTVYNVTTPDVVQTTGTEEGSEKAVMSQSAVTTEFQKYVTKTSVNETITGYSTTGEVETVKNTLNTHTGNTDIHVNSEQVDAIEVLSVDSVRYLFVPRVLAGAIMMPFVVILASVAGVLLGAVTSDMFAGLTYRAYFDSAYLGLYMKDLGVCILKAIFFGAAISLISCTCGYFASGGAKGVGLATTKAVVWSFIAIVVLDMVFAVLFFF